MPIKMMVLSVTMVLAVMVSQPVTAQSATGAAASGVSKQLAKRIVLPLTIALAAADSAHAYETHCKNVPGSEAIACTAEAFTRGQLEELRALGHDVSTVWTYVIVPNAVQYWEDHGDDIIAGAEYAADTAADAVIAVGDAVVENAPYVMDWLAKQFD